MQSIVLKDKICLKAKKAEKLCSTGCVKDQKLKITMETPAHDGTLAHLEIFHPP